MKHPIPPHYLSDPIRIAVAGCGGNGSQMLSGLARLSIALKALGHPGLAVCANDPDNVSESNVGRQLFATADVGQNKAMVLVNRLNCYYGLAWEASADARSTRVAGSAPHILVSCVDSIAARQQLAKTNCDYWLDLGNTDQKGQVILGQTRAGWRYQSRTVHPGNDLSLSRPTRLPTVLDMYPELKKRGVTEDDRPSCSLAEALERQDLFVNQHIATWALQLLWQFIRQAGLDIHGYFINLLTGRVTPLPIK